MNHFVLLDAADADRLATGNDDLQLHFEWEAGFYPAWAWAGTGDRIVGMGRWIFDCGHPGAQPGNCSVTTSAQCVIDSDCSSPTCSTCGDMETCVGAHFGYSAELHPPQATAAIRSGRGGVVSSRVPTPVPATKADIYVSSYAGGAGDGCILNHLPDPLNLLGVQCFPLVQPVAPINAQDFEFDLPMPPRPAGGRPRWRIIPLPAPGGTAPRVRVHRKLRDPQPHLRVVVRMTRRVHHMLPTGYAGTIVAGWLNDPTPLTHVRVTVNGLVVNNALQLATPVAPKTCSSHTDQPCDTAAECPSGESCLGVGPVKSWVMQAAINGEWQELTGLDTVNTSDVVPQALVYDQYLPATGAVHLEATGAAHECVDTLYGKSLGTDLGAIGFTKGLMCLNATAYPPGTLDLTYPGPDFGAGGGGSMDYETVSSGGQGGHCSTTTGLVCVVNEDCPSPESCVTTGGAFSLRYRIERLP